MTNLKKTLFATAIAVATITPAAAAEMKYPNWFAYAQASRADWDARYGDKHPAERSRPFFSCDYTPRTCLDGKISISAGDTYFIGVVVDGTDRKAVLAHVACDWSPRRAMSCADFDRGIDRNGKMVTMPDMPSSCVEEMRKSGVFPGPGATARRKVARPGLGTCHRAGGEVDRAVHAIRRSVRQAVDSLLQGSGAQFSGCHFCVG